MNHEKINEFFLCFIGSCLLCGAILPAPVDAQTFSPVSGGSRFICGFLPDGSAKLFVNNKGNYEAFDFKKARKEITKNKNRTRDRIAKLKDLKHDVKNGSSDNKSEKLAKIDVQIKALNLHFKNKKSELAGLKDCEDNVRDNPGNIEASVVVVKRKDGGVIAAKILLLVSDKKSPSYCIRRTTETPGTSYYQTFKENPCEGDVFLNGLDCTGFVPKGKLGKFNTGHTWSQPPSDDMLNEAINELDAIVAQGFSGVQAKSFDCSHF